METRENETEGYRKGKKLNGEDMRGEEIMRGVERKLE